VVLLAQAESAVEAMVQLELLLGLLAQQIAAVAAGAAVVMALHLCLARLAVAA
jgi:hypothetical protein